MKPNISVIMSAYNVEKYLAESIESILSQTYRNFEFIITDDRSTDSTYKIMSRYTDKRMKVIKNNENKGLTKNLNTMIHQSKGKYIARMDGDDISLKDRLKNQFEYMQANPETAVVGGQGILINESGEEISKVLVPIGHESILSRIFVMNQFFHPAMLIRKKALEKVHFYDEKYLKSQDYNLIFKLISEGYKVANLNEVVLKYRIHSESISQFSQSEQDYYASKAIKYGLKSILSIDSTMTAIQEMRNFLYFDRESNSLKNAIISKHLVKRINKMLKVKFGLSNNELLNSTEIDKRFKANIIKKELLKYL